MTIQFGPRCLVARFGKLRIAAMLLGSSLFGFAQAAPPVTAANTPVNIEQYSRWVAEAKGCQNIRSFKRENPSRGAVEAVLTCQALKLGGYDGEFKLVEAPNYARALLMAADGQVSMPGESVGNEDFDEKKFYFTKPLLLDGDIRVGLYVMADKLKSYNVKTVGDLRKLKATTSRNWIKDWTVLKTMGVPIVEASTWPSMLKMVAADRAQFTMMQFNPSPDFVAELEGFKFAPLPGIKVTLHGERSMAVSRAAPNALEVFNALNKGIELLRAKGTIARAWRESGYIDKRTDSWVSLN